MHDRTTPRSRRAWASGLVACVLALAACELHDERAIESVESDRAVIDRFDKYFGIAAHGSEVWVVGYSGKILHAPTPTGPWTVLRGWQKRSLFDVDTPDGRHVWAVGELGLLVHSRDGGESWAPQESGIEKENLLATDFVDTRHGWVVGEYGVMLRTRDGGESWEQLSAPSDAILNDVQFFDEQRGVVVGEFGTFLRTDDGGDSWRSPTARFEEAETYLYGVHFETPERGIVTGLQGRVYETTDGGETWKEFQLETDSPVFGAVHLPPGRAAAALAFGDKGEVYRRDGQDEQGWQPVSTGHFTYLRDAAFVDGSTGLLVGGGGLLLLTEDGGRSWEAVDASRAGARRESG